MSVKPTTIDIVVADMSRALGFYRLLGLDAPADAGADAQVNIYTPGAATIGLLTEAMMRAGDPDSKTPVGQRDLCVPMRHRRRGRCDLCQDDRCRSSRAQGALEFAVGPALRVPTRS